MVASRAVSQDEPVEPPPEVEAAPAQEAPADGEPPAATADPAAPVSPAEAFGNALREALLQEKEVQDYERTTIGLEDPAKLTGFKLERRLRVDRDADFNQRVRQFSLLPLELPSTADISQANLGRQALTFLSGLQQTYDSSRSDPQLNQMVNLNRRFLQNGDWTLRDHAVKLRESLIEREIVFNRLVERAHALVAGQVEAAELGEMETSLYTIAPELQEQAPDLSALVLQDPELAAQVLGELQAALSEPRPTAVRPPPASELWPSINGLQEQLVSGAGLTEVIAEHKSLDAELEQLDATIERSEQWTDLEARRALVDRKVELSQRRDELAHTWHTSEPDEQLYSQLVTAQDQLIRRLMLDLGAGGALFAARRDAQVAACADGLPASADERWQLLQDQQELLAQLNATQPMPDPLEKIEMLPDMPKVAPKPPAPAPDPRAAKKPNPKAKGKAAGGAKAKGKPPAKPKPKGKAPAKYQPRH